MSPLAGNCKSEPSLRSDFTSKGQMGAFKIQSNSMFDNNLPLIGNEFI
jgi:hypothetical protein